MHFVFNNGVWFENLANIPIPGAGRLDFVGLARSAGYRHTFRFTDIGSLRSGLKSLICLTDPTFVELVIEPEATGLWKDGNTQPDLPRLSLYQARRRNPRRPLTVALN